MLIQSALLYFPLGCEYLNYLEQKTPLFNFSATQTSEICRIQPHFHALSLALSLSFRANDGCLYVFDLEQNKRTLKVSVS